MTLPASSPRPLFTFAIISDTHVRPPGGDQSSPFPVNLRANGRARHAVNQIALTDPDFTIHLGDMVHPMPSLPTFGPAAEEAKRIFTPLLAKLHFVPGNHDVGDKPLKGLPAEFASDVSLALYQEHFGASWKSFRHGGCRFMMVNASLINRAIEAEDQQWQWLETELNESGKERTFLFIHYPPFITTANEPSHYDNIDEPGRSRLLDLTTRAGVEAIFSGHVHHFFYNRHGKTQLYVMPPTSFTRQDYAELFPIGPADEFGRDDRGKFGWAVVDVLDVGHRVRIVPTDGIEQGEVAPLPTPSTTHSPPRGGALVAHLRHDWAHPIALPYNGPMEEFSRKRARNDALLKRLWQLGIRNLRTPLADLLDDETRRRMADFHATGLTFTVFSLSVPDAVARAALVAAGDMVTALQLITARSDLGDIAHGLAAWVPIVGLPVLAGRLHSSADEPRHGSHFAHSVSFGFKWFEHEQAVAAVTPYRSAGVVDGLAFQINLGDDLTESLKAIDALGLKHGLTMRASVRLADENPATANFDDERILARVREAVGLVSSLKCTTLELDTLVDIDRGYHPRHGLLDRRCNFRPAGRWLAGLE